jgi:hypothetical protein
MMKQTYAFEAENKKSPDDSIKVTIVERES